MLFELLSSDEMLRLNDREKLEYIDLLEQRNAYKEHNQIEWLYPKELTYHNDIPYYPATEYVKHMEFFEAGAKYPERCFMAANRIGKSFGSGGYETALHLTGNYPDWWVGKRFSKPVVVWAAGKTNKTTRDIIQKILCGLVEGTGTSKHLSGRGLIPKNLITRTTWAQGIADMVDTIRVRHVTGGESILTLKSYERGRGAFEGDAIHVIWLDEECPRDVYEECLLRLMTTGGILFITFTPLEGLTETVLQFLPDMNPELGGM